MKGVHVWINDGTNSHPDPDNPPLGASNPAERKTYGLGMTAVARFEYPLSSDSLFTDVAT
jgi:hypothetical protein